MTEQHCRKIETSAETANIGASIGVTSGRISRLGLDLLASGQLYPHNGPLAAIYYTAILRRSLFVSRISSPINSHCQAGPSVDGGLANLWKQNRGKL